MSDGGQRRIAVIGAGPVGLAAAAHLVERGAPRCCSRRATPWAPACARGGTCGCSRRGATTSTRRRRLLGAPAGGAGPDGLPTGRELVDEYLRPLAALPRSRRTSASNTGWSRSRGAGFDKMKTLGARRAPFVLRVRSADGRGGRAGARRDRCLGHLRARPTRSAPAGCPRIGESGPAERIVYGIPDVLGAERARYAGRRVWLWAAATRPSTCCSIWPQLARQAPGTRSPGWCAAREVGGVFGGGEHDALPARGALGPRMRALVERGAAADHRLAHRRVDATTADGRRRRRRRPRGARRRSTRSSRATGFRPDLAMLRELRWGWTRPSKPGRAGAADRPERPQLRHRAAARRERAGASRAGLLHRRHEELRPRADVPAADRLRAGALGGGRAGGRLGGGARGSSWAAGDGRLLG